MAAMGGRGEGALAFNRRVIEAGRSSVNAGFDYALALAAAKSLNEAVEPCAAHVRDQLDAAVEQAVAFMVLAQDVATETVEPTRTGVAKALAKAA